MAEQVLEAARISPAALFVNVMARISFGFAPCVAMRCATWRVSARGFPEPAPATTSMETSRLQHGLPLGGIEVARQSSGFRRGWRDLDERYQRMVSSTRAALGLPTQRTSMLYLPFGSGSYEAWQMKSEPAAPWHSNVFAHLLE